MALRGLALACYLFEAPRQQRAATRRSCRVPHGVVEKVLYANLQMSMIQCQGFPGQGYGAWAVLR